MRGAPERSGALLFVFAVAPAKRSGGFRPSGRVPFCVNRKEPKNHLGEKRGFDFECKGRILAHSVFPLRTRFLRGRNQVVRRSIDRRVVSRHAKPLFPAAAPMVVVIAGSAIGGRLHGAVPLLRRRYRAQPSQARTSAAPAKREELRLTEGVGRNSAAPQKQDYARPLLRGTQGIIPCALLW